MSKILVTAPSPVLKSVPALLRLMGHRYGVTALAFAPNRTLLSGAADNITLQWDLATWASLQASIA